MLWPGVPALNREEALELLGQFEEALRRLDGAVANGKLALLVVNDGARGVLRYPEVGRGGQMTRTIPYSGKGGNCGRSGTGSTVGGGCSWLA